jgi:hypothetical protein
MWTRWRRVVSIIIAELWSLTDSDADLCAPLADLLVVHAVDGAVSPFRGRGGEWSGIGVAAAAIHLDFAVRCVRWRPLRS